MFLDSVETVRHDQDHRKCAIRQSAGLYNSTTHPLIANSVKTALILLKTFQKCQSLSGFYFKKRSFKSSSELRPHFKIKMFSLIALVLILKAGVTQHLKNGEVRRTISQNNDSFDYSGIVAD